MLGWGEPVEATCVMAIYRQPGNYDLEHFQRYTHRHEWLFVVVGCADGRLLGRSGGIGVGPSGILTSHPKAYGTFTTTRNVAATGAAIWISEIVVGSNAPPNPHLLVVRVYLPLGNLTVTDP